MATLYWLGTTSTAWATASNWTLNSNGTVNVPGAAPTTTDTAVFNSFSGGGVAAGSVVLGGSTTITSLNISGCPLITLTGAFAFVSSGVSTYTGGSFTFSNNAVTLAGLTTTSAASTGTVTFSNTGAVVLGPVTFTSSGSNVTLSNTTTMTATTMLINGSGGTLRIANTTTAIPSGLVTITSTGSVLTFAGGAVTLSGGLTVTSGSTAGAVNFNNTGAVSFNAVTFTSGGTSVTATNTTTITVGAVTVNGSAGTLSLTNGTTQSWGAGLTFSSTGANLVVGGTSVSGMTSISVPVGATGGTCTFQTAGIVSGLDNITFASTGATLQFTSAVTTITISGVTNPLNVTGTPTNIIFNNTLLTFSGGSSFSVKPNNCTMTCNVTLASSGPSVTLSSNLTTTGLVSYSTSLAGYNLVLGVYTINAGSVNINGTVLWSTVSSQINITGTTGTILTLGVSFLKQNSTGNPMIFYLTGGGSTTRSTAINSSAADPNIVIASGSFTLTHTSGTFTFGTADFTGFTGTLSSASAMSVSGNLTLGAGMTVSTAGVTFIGTSIYTANGVGLPSGCNFTVNGAGASVTIASAVANPLSRLYLYQGTLNLNNFDFECLSFSSWIGSAAAYARTLNGGSSSSGTITIRASGGSPLNQTTPFVGPNTVGAGGTYTATNNPTFIFESNDATLTPSSIIYAYFYSEPLVNLGSFIVKNAVGNLPYTLQIWNSAPTMTNYTVDTGFTGTITYTGANDHIITNNLFLGANATLGTSATVGYQHFVPASATGTVTVNQSIARPFTVANNATGTTQFLTNVTTTQLFTLTTGTLNLNDYFLTCGTFNSSVAGTRAIAFGSTGQITTTGTGVVWNAVDTISVTGTSNVKINNATATATTITSGAATTEANSINFYVLSGTYSLTISGVFKNLDFTGFSGTLPVGAAFTCYGDLTFSSGMTKTAGGTGTFTLKGSGTQYLTTESTGGVGKTIDHPVTMSGTGSYTLIGALTMGATATSIFTHTSGTLNLGGQTLTTLGFTTTGTATRAINFNSGNFVITGSTATAWSAASNTNLTITGVGSISMTGATAKTFAAGCNTYPVISQDGAGVLTFTGASIYNTVTNTVNSTVVPTAILYTPLAPSVTAAVGTPGVFTVAAGSSPPSGVPVAFSATALPGGISAFPTVYYVYNISSTTFSVSTTMAGALSGTNLVQVTSTGTTVVANFGNGVYSFSINGRSGTSFAGTGSISTTTLTITATTTSGLRVGSFVTGTNIGTPARITALGTGTGGNGTYTITPSQTAASGAVTASNDLSLASTVNGTKHYLSDPTGVVSTVQYVGIRDSQALGGAIWFASNESNDYLNNTGWNFVQATANMMFFMPR